MLGLGLASVCSGNSLYHLGSSAPNSVGGKKGLLASSPSGSNRSSSSSSSSRSSSISGEASLGLQEPSWRLEEAKRTRKKNLEVISSRSSLFHQTRRGKEEQEDEEAMNLSAALEGDNSPKEEAKEALKSSRNGDSEGEEGVLISNGGISSPASRVSPSEGAQQSGAPAVSSSQLLHQAHHPPPLFPPGLQQMQQILQSQLGGFSPSQLQQFVAQQQLQQDAGRKQLEAFLQQLQEQLQINILQQTHLMQTGRSGQGAALQQLQIQQQQLISQLQLIQQRILTLPNFQTHLRKDEFSLLERVSTGCWKENGEASGGKSHSPKPPKGKESSKEDFLGSSLPPLGLLPPLLDPRLAAAASQQHPLFSHGTCRWTGCDTQCEDLGSFLKHIASEHLLDDKSTAQARVQMQIVSQLELQLQKERERLQAMMAHLHLSKEAEMKGSTGNNSNPGNQISASKSSGHSSAGSNGNMMAESTPERDSHAKTPPKSSSSSSAKGNNNPLSSSSAFPGGPYPSPLGLRDGGSHPNPLSALSVAARSPSLPSGGVSSSSSSGPMRRRVSDKAPIPMNMPYMLDRAGLDIAQEIYRNREFYRTQDVRPPFTYASLIRQAIIESPHNRLSLCEIYNWFQNTFAHFNQVSTTWKNAIRANLSLHKCFVRYEDDFGSFWMVDDAEFLKRRHLSRGGPRKYEPSAGAPPTRSASGSGAPLAGAGGSLPSASNTPTSHQSVRNKSPTPFPTSPNAAAAAAYGEALNASLQTALGFAVEGSASSLPFLNQGGIAAAAAAALSQQNRSSEFNMDGGVLRPSSADYLKIRNSLMAGRVCEAPREDEDSDFVKRESSSASPHLRRLSSEDNGGSGYDFMAAARAAAVSFNGNSHQGEEEEDMEAEEASPPEQSLNNNNNNSLKNSNNVSTRSHSRSGSSEEIKREKF